MSGIEKEKIEKQGYIKNIPNVVVDGANKHRNKPVDPDIKMQ